MIYTNKTDKYTILKQGLTFLAVIDSNSLMSREEKKRIQMNDNSSQSALRKQATEHRFYNIILQSMKCSPWNTKE